ncbi:MAG TPA: tyrosinase family oxidase copper chaperone, partial [Actinoplanes sp.]|nr:tyrosinase family oxidase copper chaperone [Actinoplanes sp.]
GRRTVLRITAGAVVATAVGAGQALSDHTAVADPKPTPPDDTEIYRGRRIRIRRLQGIRPGEVLPADTVLIDEMPLHVMSNADSTFTPMTHHYQTFRTLRAASRAAVDSLGKATLLPLHDHN